METKYIIIIAALLLFYLYKVITGKRQYSRLKNLLDSGSAFTLIDVRTPGEYSAGHIPGARNIVHDKIGSSLKKVAKDQEIVLYCHSGSRAAAALNALKSKGYTNAWNFGSLSRWRGTLER